MEWFEAVTADFSFRIWPDGRQIAGVHDHLFKRLRGIACRDSTRGRSDFRGKYISQSVQKKFEQSGAIQLVSLLQRMNQVRGAGALDGGIYLGLVNMQFVGEAQVGRAPAILQREFQ